jgi:two-component system sensor histidine kinase TctE
MLASVALIWLLAGRGTLSHQKLKMTVAETSLESLLAFDRNRDAKESNPFFNALLSHVQFAMRVQQEFLVNMARRFTTSIGEIKEQLDKLDQHQSASRVSGEIALRMRDCVDNMSRQADQLAVLARAEPSLFDRTQSQVVNLDGLIGEVLQTYSEQAKSRQIELKFDLEPVLVFGDRTLLRDMLDNLLDNAIRYSAIGGKVIVTCDAERGAVVLRVEDSGPGFPESERRILFDRLLPSGNIVGAGLGLAIIRDIAKAHGANIVLQQAAGGMGSVVLVNFPQDG